MFSSGFTSFSVLLLFPLSITFLIFMHGFCNIHHKDLLTYFGGTDRPGELCYSFSISNDLTQRVNFLIRVPDCDSRSPALLDLFLSGASICSTMGFPPLRNSNHIVVSVFIDFLSSSKGVPCFMAWLMAIFVLIGTFFKIT